MLITKEHFDKIYKENKVLCTCLVLILNNECNADCAVCLGKQVFKSGLCKQICEGYSTKCLRCCDRTATDEEFYERLGGILQTLNSPHVSIILTGGEPTISSRLIPVLEIIDKYTYISKSIEIETNGANLLDAEIAQALIKRNVQIHLSRYCIDDTENTGEFKYSFAETKDADIAKLARIYGSLLGTSTVLLKKHIPNVNALTEFVEHYRGYGIKQFAFLEVMADTSLRSANKELLKYFDEQLITIEELSEQLSKLGYEKTDERGGDSFKIIMHPYKDGLMTFTMSNLSLQHNQQTSNGFSRFLIMPSGEIGVNGIEIR